MSVDVVLPTPDAPRPGGPGPARDDAVAAVPRLVLHVGLPKTATTYLQHRLRLNTAALARHGVRIPLDRPWRHPYQLSYRAALDLREMRHGLADADVAGRWDRLVARVRRTRGLCVVSHELLAGATQEQAQRALDDLAGTEVHLVVTARELGRQLAGGWQEALKHGKNETFESYLRRAREGRLPIMRSFDLPRVLETWGGALPPERVHLVTVPSDPGSGALVWERFASTAGIDPGWAPLAPTQTNASVSVEQAQLLQALNVRLGPLAERGGRYAGLIDDVVARATPPDGRRIELPERHRGWVARRTARAQAWVAARGIQVHGALTDLDPMPCADVVADPDAAVDVQAQRAGVEAIVALLEESHRRRRAGWHLRRQGRRMRSYLRDTFGG